MAKNRKPPEEEEDKGAPEWMVTFSDCMTLLLTFFVLLLSFSSFDEEAMSKVQQSIGLAMPSYATQSGNLTTSLAEKKTIKLIEMIPEGSKIPSPTDKQIGQLSKKRRLTKLENQKVFSIPSKKIFLGEASAINPKNKKILDYLVVFLKAMPSRVVISEYDPSNPSKSNRKNTQRAWAIMEYFINSNVKAERFSITGSSMLTRNENIKGRHIVVTLLEEGVYK